jgi:hypothetical protein
VVLTVTVYDHDLLLKFAKTFPDSPLTDFIDDYCRWFHLPLPEPEGEAAEDAELIDGEGEAKPKAPAPKKSRGGKRGRAGLNARERRKARRLAEKDGALSEDLDQEERDELVASMTVSSRLAPWMLPKDADCRRNYWTSCQSPSLRIESWRGYQSRKKTGRTRSPLLKRVAHLSRTSKPSEGLHCPGEPLIPSMSMSTVADVVPA